MDGGTVSKSEAALEINEKMELLSCRENDHDGPN